MQSIVDKYLEQSRLNGVNIGDETKYKQLESKKKQLRRKLWGLIPKKYSEIIDEYCDLCEESLMLMCINAYVKGAKDGFKLATDNFMEEKDKS